MNQKKIKKIRKLAKRLSEEKGLPYAFFYKFAKKKYKNLSKKERII